MSVPSRSLSIVEAIPTTGTPAGRGYGTGLRAVAADNDHAVDAELRQVAERLGSTCSSRNSADRALPRNVPPTLDDAAHVAGTELADLTVHQALPPWRTPNTVMPWSSALRVTARIAAFMPGASPPLVRPDMLHASRIMARRSWGRQTACQSAWRQSDVAALPSHRFAGWMRPPHEVHRMTSTVSKPRGRHFFANPGPTNIPDSVLRAIDRPSIDFHDPDFRAIRYRSRGTT